jgi:hypothetical protein
MLRYVFGVVAVVILGSVSACSSQSPITPSRTPQRTDALSPEPVATPGASADLPLAAAPAVSGTYTLSFLDTSLQPVTTLPVGGPELVLGAHVEGTTGPATRGQVTFEYCAYRGLPPNDITRPDEAPMSACADGSARWKSLRSVQVDASGNAYLDFGVVQIPRTVGFRFRYQRQGGSIADGVGGPADFTWIAS